MKIVMTLLVRDEQDILRANIEYHLAQGVDFIIATDNRSVDGTEEILKEFGSKGLLRYIFEESDDYNQHAWVTRMARMAKVEYGADWVINNDADEFWWPLEGNLKETFERVHWPVNVIQADRHNFVAMEESDAPFWHRMRYRERKSLNALGVPLPPKAAHRGSATVLVDQGNHSVRAMEEGVHLAQGSIEILHYPIRNYRQIENKIAKGGAAYQRNQELPESTGMTWRKLYEDLQRDSNLSGYFDNNFYDEARIASELGSGEIVLDERLFYNLSALQFGRSKLA